VYLYLGWISIFFLSAFRWLLERRRGVKVGCVFAEGRGESGGGVGDLPLRMGGFVMIFGFSYLIPLEYLSLQYHFGLSSYLKFINLKYLFNLNLLIYLYMLVNSIFFIFYNFLFLK